MSQAVSQEIKIPKPEVTDNHVTKLQKACNEIDEFGKALDLIFVVLESQGKE